MYCHGVKCDRRRQKGTRDNLRTSFFSLYCVVMPHSLNESTCADTDTQIHTQGHIRRHHPLTGRLHTSGVNYLLTCVPAHVCIHAFVNVFILVYVFVCICTNVCVPLFLSKIECCPTISTSVTGRLSGSIATHSMVIITISSSSEKKKHIFF